MTRRYSVACRPVESKGLLLKSGHGGWWSPDEGGPCPKCGRALAVLGAVAVQSVDAGASSVPADESGKGS